MRGQPTTPRAVVRQNVRIRPKADVHRLTKGAPVIYETYAAVPWYRKNWFVVLSILIVYLWPFLLLSMATGDLYYKDKEKGEPKRTSKLVVVGFMAVMIAIAVLFGVLFGDFSRDGNP